MTLSELVESVGQFLGLADCSLNSSGVCQLVIDGHVRVTIEENTAEECAHIYATVGTMPEQDREEFYAVLLEAQLFAREIGEGCAFGLDRTTTEVLLHRKLGLQGVEPEGFMNILSEFINWAEHWQQKLAAGIVDPLRDGMDGLPQMTYIRA